MIKIDFSVDGFPNDLSESYSLTAYTEGTLKISVDEEIIFDEPGILLIELFTSLHKWLSLLDDNNQLDYYYESMDFEEKPILAFDYIHKLDKYEIKSVWGHLTAYVTLEEITNACTIFFSDLKNELLTKYDFKLPIPV